METAEIKDVQLSVRLKDEAGERFRIQAERHGLSNNDFARLLIAEGLNRREQHQGGQLNA